MFFFSIVNFWFFSTTHNQQWFFSSVVKKNINQFLTWFNCEKTEIIITFMSVYLLKWENLLGSNNPMDFNGQNNSMLAIARAWTMEVHFSRIRISASCAVDSVESNNNPFVRDEVRAAIWRTVDNKRGRKMYWSEAIRSDSWTWHELEKLNQLRVISLYIVACPF